MKISSVSCRQFAGLRNLKPIEFEAGLNILYGENESGKSTLVGLLYSLLWQSCKVGKGTKEDKKFRASYFPAEVRSGDRGSVIDGRLVLEGGDGLYTITKKWHEAGSGELETPSAVLYEAQDAAAYAERLKTLLRYGEGVYREAVFANQKTTDGILQALFAGKLDSDLSAVASSVLLDMGGISSEKFMTAIEDRMKDLENSWDWKTDGPKGGRGIDHKIGRNVGGILEAYYEWQDSREKYRIRKEKADAVGRADKAYAEALAAFKEAERAFETLNDSYSLLVSYQKTGALKTAADAERRRREEARAKWLGLKADAERAESLRAERDRAEAIALLEQLREIGEQDKELEDRLRVLPAIDPEEVETVRLLSGEIQNLENSLKTFSALLSFQLNPGYELIVTSEADGRTIKWDGSFLELTESVKIEIPDVAVIHLSAAELDVEAAGSALKRKKEQRERLLAKYEADSYDVLLRKQADVREEKKELESRRRSLALERRRLLNGREQTEAEADYTAAMTEKTRSLAEIETEIAGITAEPVETFIRLCRQTISTYEKEYESPEKNTARIKELESAIAKYESELLLAQQLPAAFQNIADPDAYRKTLSDRKNSLREEKDTAYQALQDARAAVNAMEENEEYASLEELSESISDKEKIWLARKEEYQDWKQIKDAAEEILHTAGEDPLRTLEEDFGCFLAILSDEKVTLASLDKKLEADIYSGNHKMTYELLSEGTKDTISLAFRLAVIRFLFPEGGAFVVFDDPFTDMDEARRERACALLREFAKTNQVIFATCDSTYKERLGGHVIELESE